MANEFIIKNGYRSQGDSQITGSAIVSGSMQITGSLSATDSASFASLNTNTRSLSAVDGLAVSWTDRKLYDSNSSTLSADWRLRRLHDSSTSQSIDWGARRLSISSGPAVLDWTVQRLYDTTSILSADWRLRLFHDSSTSQSIDWDNRSLKNSTESTVLDWKTLVAYDGNVKQSINWGQRKLYDSNATQSADWRTRVLLDTNTSQSINWNSRLLKDNIGNDVLDWQNGQFTGTASYATQALSASWAPGGGGTPGGSDTYIQFNNSNTFDGSPGLTYIYGINSLINGNGSAATGQYSHAEGAGTTADGESSHAEGRSSGTANGADFSHAEGYSTTTYGTYSHAEGSGTNTLGYASHAEGFTTITGANTGYLVTMTTPGVVLMDSSHGDQSAFFIPGSIIAIDDFAYDNTLGYISATSVVSSSYDGTNTSLFLYNTTVTTTSASIASIDNLGSNSGTYRWGGKGTHAEGVSSAAVGFYSHAEGASYAYGNYSHAEGTSTAYGDVSHAEGEGTSAYGANSHAEGAGTFTYGANSHAEGGSTTAGYRALVPKSTIASGVFDLAIEHGDVTADFTAGALILIRDDQGDISGVPTTHIYEVASSTYGGIGSPTQITLVDTTVNTTTDKYAVGLYGQPAYSKGVTPIGDGAHAEGAGTQAFGQYSHAGGNETRALGWYQSVVGKFNAPIPAVGAFIVGDGTSDGTRNNLLVAASGSVVISGSLLVSGSITSTSGIRTKAGAVAYSSFAGTPLTATVTFTTPFDTSNYAVTVTGEDARSWTVTSKTTSGFDINSNSSVALIGDTYWQATLYGEFNG